MFIADASEFISVGDNINDFKMLIKEG